MKYDINISGKVDTLDIPQLLEEVSARVEELIEREQMDGDHIEFYLKRANMNFITEVPSKAEVMVTIKLK